MKGKYLAGILVLSVIVGAISAWSQSGCLQGLVTRNK